MTSVFKRNMRSILKVYDGQDIVNSIEIGLHSNQHPSKKLMILTFIANVFDFSLHPLNFEVINKCSYYLVAFTTVKILYQERAGSSRSACK